MEEQRHKDLCCKDRHGHPSAWQVIGAMQEPLMAYMRHHALTTARWEWLMLRPVLVSETPWFNAVSWGCHQAECMRPVSCAHPPLAPLSCRN
jgi:hypothetical protein